MATKTPEEIAAEEAAKNKASKDKDILARLETENAELKKRLAALEKEKTDAEAAELPIREKMSAGLTREQAELVVKQQREHDEHMAKLEEAKKKAAQSR